MVGIINWLRGYLKIRVTGAAVERFINLCGYRNILLWNVSRCENCYEMFISLKAFRELRSIVRKTKTKAAILQRYGLPFFMLSMNKRKMFVFGCIFTIWFWQISGNFIWQIDIQGNFQITEEQISDYLESQEIHIGMLKKRLDIEQLEKDLRITFPEIIWASGKIESTAFLLNIKESEGAKVREVMENEGQYDILAPVDGDIYSIIVRSGIPKVRQGDTVTKDMVLVEGIVPVMNEDGTIRENLYVKSDADIYIKHIIDYEDSLPAKYIYKFYTGREKKVPYIRIGEGELTLRSAPDYFVSDVVIQESTPSLFKELKIPLKWGSFTHREYMNVETLYSKEVAQSLLEEKFQKFLTTLSEKGVQIIEKDVKIIENGDNWIVTGQIVVAEPVALLQKVEQTDVVEALENE